MAISMFERINSHSEFCAPRSDGDAFSKFWEPQKVYKNTTITEKCYFGLCCVLNPYIYQLELLPLTLRYECDEYSANMTVILNSVHLPARALTIMRFIWFRYGNHISIYCVGYAKIHFLLTRFMCPVQSWCGLAIRCQDDVLYSLYSHHILKMHYFSPTCYLLLRLTI